MEFYLQFVSAAESKDLNSLIWTIREHPELHDYEGDDGSLLDVIYHNCPLRYRVDIERRSNEGETALG